MSFYKWKPSKTAKKEFAEKMDEIDEFCEKNKINQSSSSDSYYFALNGVLYRISNHSIKSSPYHSEAERAYTFCIHASKTRIIEIYNAIKQGKKIDHRGNAI